MTPLALERGTSRMDRSYLRLVVYEPEVPAPPLVACDLVMRSVQALFEQAIEDMRASPRWADVHLESGRTAGDRFEYVVLHPREPAEDDESIVGAVVVAPADAVEGGSFRVTADVSGEETGTIHFESPQRDVPLDALREAAVRGAEEVLGWLRRPAVEERE